MYNTNNNNIWIIIIVVQEAIILHTTNNWRETPGHLNVICIVVVVITNIVVVSAVTICGAAIVVVWVTVVVIVVVDVVTASPSQSISPYIDNAISQPQFVEAFYQVTVRLLNCSKQGRTWSPGRAVTMGLGQGKPESVDTQRRHMYHIGTSLIIMNSIWTCFYTYYATMLTDWRRTGQGPHIRDRTKGERNQNFYT